MVDALEIDFYTNRRGCVVLDRGIGITWTAGAKVNVSRTYGDWYLYVHNLAEAPVAYNLTKFEVDRLLGELTDFYYGIDRKAQTEPAPSPKITTESAWREGGRVPGFYCEIVFGKGASPKLDDGDMINAEFEEGDDNCADDDYGPCTFCGAPSVDGWDDDNGQEQCVFCEEHDLRAAMASAMHDEQIHSGGHGGVEALLAADRRCAMICRCVGEGLGALHRNMTGGDRRREIIGSEIAKLS